MNIEFNWNGKQKSGIHYSSCDVAISKLTKTNKNFERYGFCFGRDSLKALGFKYFVFAVADERIYLKSADEKVGYKVSCKGDNYAGYTQVSTNDLDGYEGEYSLKFDTDCELFYLSKKQFNWNGKV